MRAWWLLFSIGACGGGGGGGDSGNCPGFATIVDGTFSRSSTTLTWTLEVEELPATLEFDREDTPSFVLEYGWGIDLDVDGDGERDLEVAAKHFKMDVAPHVEPPLAVLQTDLWRIEGPAATLTGFADASIAGNTFTFTVEEDEDAGLALVTDPAQSTFTTFFLIGPSGLDQCTDSL